ncbi:MAG: hypothetical protein IJ867_01030 [Clostridia bacterium]|nr:hypothetical protein [Clostridia bacterium]
MKIEDLYIKFDNFFKIVCVICLLMIPVCIGLLIYYSFTSKVYLKINRHNYSEIIEMIRANENIQVKGDITEIGYRQGLGDWILSIRYDEDVETIILNDDDARDLKRYISKNGFIAGMKGRTVFYTLKASVIIVILFVIYKFFYLYCRLLRYIGKKTDEIIK